jgi:hypothetical protein
MIALLTVLKQHFHKIEPQQAKQFKIVAGGADSLCILDEKVCQHIHNDLAHFTEVLAVIVHLSICGHLQLEYQVLEQVPQV